MGGGERWTLAPSAAGAIPVAFLGLTLLTRFGNAVYWSGLAGGVMLAGLFVLPLLYTLPGGRALWSRHRGWLLVAVEAVRIAVLGVPWAGSGAEIITWMLVATANTGIAFFGLVRLSDMVTALHAARTELADLAVARERRWSAERLRSAIGGLPERCQTGDHLGVHAALWGGFNLL
jgi:hypothetical protein